MNIANCRLMGLALQPWLPSLDIKSVIMMIIINDASLDVALLHQVGG